MTEETKGTKSERINHPELEKLMIHLWAALDAAYAFLRDHKTQECEDYCPCEDVEGLCWVMKGAESMIGGTLMDFPAATERHRLEVKRGYAAAVQRGDTEQIESWKLLSECYGLTSETALATVQPQPQT
jgi:hypothetical protein